MAAAGRSDRHAARGCSSSARLVAVLAATLGLSTLAGASPVVHHDIEVRVDPAQHMIAATDRFDLPAPVDWAGWVPGFYLHRDLAVDEVRVDGHRVDTVDPAPDVSPTSAATASGNDPLEGYEHWRFVGIDVDPAAASHALEVRYSGTLFDSLAAPTVEHARSFETTTGLVDTVGVYLTGSTGWYPSGTPSSRTRRKGPMTCRLTSRPP